MAYITSYEVRIKNRAGIMQYRLSNFNHMSYQNILNDVGLLELRLPFDHPAVALLEEDGQVEVWRESSTLGIDAYCDFYGLFRASRPTMDERGVRYFTAYCPEKKHLLWRPIVAYKANTADRSAFTSDPIETIAKTIVTYNATGAGTTGDGRERTLGSWTDYISVQSDSAAGDSIDFRCAWGRVIGYLQELARRGDADFDLVKTAARAWEFQWFPGQLGTDRSATVIFSDTYGNFESAESYDGGLEEMTVCLVGGDDVEANRSVEVRTGQNYEEDYNEIEFFYNAPQGSPSTAVLQAKGDEALEEARAKAQLMVKVKQSVARRYGRDLFLGDRVGVQVFGNSTVQKLSKVTVSVASGSGSIETIDVDFQEVQES